METFTQAEYEFAFNEILRSLISSVSPCRPTPKACLLGGQPGAGKSRIVAKLNEQMGGNTVYVDTDSFRPHHPRFTQLEEKYGKESVTYTAEFSGRITEKLIDTLGSQGYGLIIEGTLRTANVPLNTADKLKEKGLYKDNIGRGKKSSPSPALLQYYNNFLMLKPTRLPKHLTGKLQRVNIDRLWRFSL
ncbi:MAG: zeta toxin family protein [Clostridiales Family XIII bacterium]|jgi:UDP-N-acetylglucosamine kinase|nr:zeta toxin family protein [Clostridiales Family XIII bacterium]